MVAVTGGRIPTEFWPDSLAERGRRRAMEADMTSVRLSRMPGRERTTAVLGAVAVTLFVAAAPAAAVDLSGRWLVERGNPSPAFVIITQVGDTVAIPTDGFSTTVDQVEGTVAAPGDFNLTGAGGCIPLLHGRLLPNENVMHGTFASLCPALTLASLAFTRCGCFDGNTTSGDGCDAACQVEPCYTCSGDPSVCTPTADGGSCDDRRDCTTGETCSAGACGNATPISPCVDVTGTWAIHDELVDFTPPEPLDYVVNLTQRDGLVRWNSYLGPIDLVTGAFALEAPTAAFLAGGNAFVPLTGVAGTATLSGNGLRNVGSRTLFPTVITGTRLLDVCGDGVVKAPEACDDGNIAPGDGCTGSCTVEPCFACVGSPSTCGPPTSCRASTTPERAVLKIDNRSPDDRDALGWKWPGGAALAPGDLGDPVADDGYTLCLFDESSGTPVRLLAAAAPAGGSCAGKPCWKAKGPGFRYKDKASTPNGVTALVVKAGEAGKSLATVTAKGALLGPPVVPLPLPLRVQLQVEGGACLEARYEAGGVLVNDAERGKFKARASASP